MKNQRQVVCFVVVCLMVLGLGFARAEGQKIAHPMKKAENSAPAMSPEQKAQMDQMMKLSTPGEQHHVLDVLVGKWNHHVSWKMTADAKPEESKGTNVNHWIFGNRFLQQDVHGTNAMGQPFEGMGLMGYDTMKQEYTSVWLDNMSTSMMKATSKYDPNSKTFAEAGTFSCPMTGEKDRAYRAVMKIVDKDHYSYEMFVKTPDGKEFKSLEIAYERTKQAKISQR